MSFTLPFHLFAPSEKPRSLLWAIDNVNNTDGKPYDHLHYPHLGAPNGPFDAFDDPLIREISKQYASRLGKTFWGQCCQLFIAAVEPGPQMFASSTEKTATDVVARTYRLADQCPPLRKQLRPEGFRRQDRIDFAHSRIDVAWSRSVSTLADKDVKIGHANEVDKWEHQSTSKEAHPLKLFDNRFKNIPSHKKIYESTPTLKGQSAIEDLRLAADNRQYFVPCPHCKRYQTLRLGSAKEPGGIVWDKGAGGRSDPILANKTARYVCLHCSAEIFDHHRAPMMRAGVWVPEGCGVDDERALHAANHWPGILAARGYRDDGRRLDGVDLFGRDEWCYLTGQPHRAGRAASFQLSSFYALSLDWGSIASEWVNAAHDPIKRQDFVNSWEARTWERVHSKSTWQQLGERLILENCPHGVVPEGYSVLSAAIDKQIDHYVYTVVAWSPTRNSHTIDYGWADTLEEILDGVILADYKHADGGPPLRPACTLIDTGYEPKEPYEFSAKCLRKNIEVMACKGSSAPLGGPYRESKLGKDSSMPGLPLILIDSLYTQDWIERKLHHVKPGDDGAMSVFTLPLLEHQDYLEQLLNESLVTKLDEKTGREKTQWEKIVPKRPNDYRACYRYAIVAMMLAQRGSPIRPRGYKPQAQPTTPRVRMPDGRPFLVTERS